MLYAESIDEILSTRDSFTAERLLQHFTSADDPLAFAAALIARLLLAETRSGKGQP